MRVIVSVIKIEKRNESVTNGEAHHTMFQLCDIPNVCF